MTPDERIDALAVTMQELAASTAEMKMAHIEAEKMIKRFGRYAMVIARIHENDLADHHKRLLALEEELNEPS